MSIRNIYVHVHACVCVRAHGVHAYIYIINFSVYPFKKIGINYLTD